MTARLTYDNLPAGCAILREWKDGALILTAVAREMNAGMKRRAASRAAFDAVITTTFIAAVFLVFAIPVAPRNTGVRWLAPGMLALLLVALGSLFLLVWHNRWQARRDQVEHSLREQTVLIASENKLLVETSGPRRSLSLSLRDGEIVDVLAHADFFQRRPDRLEIRCASGPIELLQGHPPAELEWVARTLREIISQSPESPRGSGC